MLAAILPNAPARCCGSRLEYAASMLEEAIAQLTAEVRKLREAVENERAARTSAQAPEAPPPASEFITDLGVSRLLGVSRCTLFRWWKTGEGPPVRRLGRLIRYSRCEVIQWMRTRGPKGA